MKPLVILTSLLFLLTGCGKKGKVDLQKQLDLKPKSSELAPSVDISTLAVIKNDELSPSKNYVLSAHALNDSPSLIVIRLCDPHGRHLDAFVTECSSKQQWATGWHKDKDAIVLWTPNGTMVYNVSTKGIISIMECPQPEYGDTGLSLMKAKYQQEAEPQR